MSRGSQKKIYVREIDPGCTIKSTFVVRKKQIKLARSGDPYIALELSDKTGTISAKVWQRVDLIKDLFKEDDVVYISGRAVSYRDHLEIKIASLNKIKEEDIDYEDYLPSLKRDKDELIGYLFYFIEEIYNPFLSRLLNDFFRNEDFFKDFINAPAAKVFHHAYLGGLLEHTVSVAILCENVAQLYLEVDKDILLTAAMLHDIGKVSELEFKKRIGYSDEGKFIGHLIIGERMITEKIKEIPGFPNDLELKLRHAILSHHGELEWGSPKKPSTIEALILHHIDNLDAKVSGYRDIVYKHVKPDVRWTDLKNLFRRPLYIPKSINEEDELIAAEKREEYKY